MTAASIADLSGVAERFLDRLSEDQLVLFADACRALLEDVPNRAAPSRR